MASCSACDPGQAGGHRTSGLQSFIPGDTLPHCFSPKPLAFHWEMAISFQVIYTTIERGVKESWLKPWVQSHGSNSLPFHTLVWPW